MRARTASWFETKIKYQKMQEDGTEKVVTEYYIVEAMSCTAAEASVIEEITAYCSGDMSVPSTKEANFNEIFFSDIADDDKWYTAKLQFITIDDKSDKEKRSNVNYLVQAKSLARALRYVDEVMGKSMLDYDIVGINETKIYDVFERKSESDKASEKNDEQNQ